MSQIKTIQTDFFQSLEARANDFLANTPNIVLEKIICDDFIILSNGNAANNFTCQYYHMDGADPIAQQIKLIMRDNRLDLKKAMNEALLALFEDNNDIVDVQRNDAILDNGNKYYCACIVYQPAQELATRVFIEIIEEDNIGDLERSSNNSLTGKAVTPIGVLRQEIILANGNRVYTCTIPYTIPE